MEGGRFHKKAASGAKRGAKDKHPLHDPCMTGIKMQIEGILSIDKVLWGGVS